MQVEYYKITPRARRRLKRRLATPEGRREAARILYDAHKILDWRIKNKGFTLPPDEMEEHERIMARRGVYIPSASVGQAKETAQSLSASPMEMVGMKMCQ